MPHILIRIGFRILSKILREGRNPKNLVIKIGRKAITLRKALKKLTRLTSEIMERESIWFGGKKVELFAETTGTRRNELFFGVMDLIHSQLEREGFAVESHSLHPEDVPKMVVGKVPGIISERVADVIRKLKGREVERTLPVERPDFIGRQVMVQTRLHRIR